MFCALLSTLVEQTTCLPMAVTLHPLPQKIVASARVAAEVTEELSKFGDADFDAVTQLSERFLTNVRVWTPMSP